MPRTRSARLVDAMSFETTLTVPTRDLRQFMNRLARAGFTVLDTGERISTDHGPDAEATVRLLHLSEAQIDHSCELGVSA